MDAIAVQDYRCGMNRTSLNCETRRGTSRRRSNGSRASSSTQHSTNNGSEYEYSIKQSEDLSVLKPEPLVVDFPKVEWIRDGRSLEQHSKSISQQHQHRLSSVTGSSTDSSRKSLRFVIPTKCSKKDCEIAFLCRVPANLKAWNPSNLVIEDLSYIPYVADFGRHSIFEKLPSTSGYVQRKENIDGRFLRRKLKERCYLFLHKCTLFWFQDVAAYSEHGLHGCLGGVNFVLLQWHLESVDEFTFILSSPTCGKTFAFTAPTSGQKGGWMAAIMMHLNRGELIRRMFPDIDWRMLEWDVITRYETQNDKKSTSLPAISKTWGPRSSKLRLHPDFTSPSTHFWENKNCKRKLVLLTKFKAFTDFMRAFGR